MEHYMEEDCYSLTPEFNIGDSVYFTYNDELFNGIIQNISPCNHHNMKYLFYTIIEDKMHIKILVESDMILKELNSEVILIEILEDVSQDDLMQVKEYENFSFVIW